MWSLVDVARDVADAPFSLARWCSQVRDALDTSNFEAVAEEDKVIAYTGSQQLFEGF